MTREQERKKQFLRDLRAARGTAAGTEEGTGPFEQTRLVNPPESVEERTKRVQAEVAGVREAALNLAAAMDALSPANRQMLADFGSSHEEQSAVREILAFFEQDGIEERLRASVVEVCEADHEEPE